MTLAELVSRWRSDAERFEQLGYTEAAAHARAYAAELDEALRQHALEELTPAQAAEERGCDPSTIRRRFPGRKTITRAELYHGGAPGPDLAGAILRESYHGGRVHGR